VHTDAVQGAFTAGVHALQSQAGQPPLQLTVDAFKDLPEVRLGARGVLGLAQNLQQLVIGQEVEAREGQALAFQVLVQPFLNLLQPQQSLPE
jgi:hypothetical protein